MKKFLLFFATLLSIGFTAKSDDGVITLKTSKAIGESFQITAYCTTINDAFTVDWGDGTTKTYNVDPNSYGYAQRITENIKGQTIKITGPLVKFECTGQNVTEFSAENETLLQNLDLAGNSISSFNATSMPVLTELDLSENNLTALNLTGFSSVQKLDISKNQIDSHQLVLDDLAGSLTDFSANDNKLVTLNMMAFGNLSNFNANDNPELTTVVFKDGSEKLKYISMNNCDIVHFYAISLPNLVQLNLSDNSLWDFEKGNYPKLSTFSIANNGLTELDVTQFPNLTSLYCGGNKLTQINVSSNPELISLNVSNNQLTELNLQNNKSITGLYCSGNKLTKLDISMLGGIQYLEVSDNDIRYVDLSNAYYLRSFKAVNTLCPSFYFNYVSPFGRFAEIDVRNNKNMTSASINFMFMTLPQHYNDSNKNTLLIEGSNGEHSDPTYPQSSDMKWKLDVEGDKTATNDDVEVTVNATNTGEMIDVTGQFGGMAAEQSFSFTKWATDKGSFYISQWSGPYYQQLADVTTKAKTGVFIHVTPTPAEGYKFKSVTVNGVEIEEEWFIINEKSEITVNFVPEERSFSFTTGNGQALSFALYGAKNQTPIAIDWGNGARQSTTIGTGVKRFDGTADGTTITVYGDVIAVNLESYGEFGDEYGLWNNNITGVDFSNNEMLVSVNTYMNPIREINVSNLKNLVELDASYCDLATIDVSNNTKLQYLSCYGNELSSLDVSKNPELVELNARVNQLESIDLKNNSALQSLNLTNNKLQSIDLSNLTNLEELSLMGNLLTAVDLSKNTNITDLSIGRNALTALDLSKNTKLTSLSFNDNFIKSIDLSMLKGLLNIDCGGNGMTACEMDDFYYNLPQWTGDPEEVIGSTITVLTGEEDRPNDASNADSGIATEKGWKPSITGNASGCDMAHLIISPTVNGTITLTDSDGKTINSGDKVAKNSPINVASTPDAGYELSKVEVNGKAIEGSSFSITRIARVVASFTKAGAVDSIELDGVAIATRSGLVEITAPEGSVADIYNMAGTLVAGKAIDGTTSIALESGAYVVRVANAQGTMARVVVVK